MANPKVLFIAYHFPPIQGSSGYLRTLKFVKYLAQAGWEPVVLTVNLRAYESTQENLNSLIPNGIKVHRAFALNAKKHLAFGGRYPTLLALPDRMSTWIPSAIFKGVNLMRKDPEIQAVVSTYPISSAHAIGLGIKKLTGKPWIADFRDPMWDEFLAVSASELSFRKSIERRTIHACDHALVTTQGMKDLYRVRYPDVDQDRITFLPNGYDEEDFAALDAHLAPPTDGPLEFMHAGLLDPVDRDPTAFLQGVAELVKEQPEWRARIRIRFLAPGSASLVSEPVARMGLQDVVTVEAALPYREALKAMARTHVLLLFQGLSCEHQIPAKLYEYVRIGRPILALTSETGETGRLVKQLKAGVVAHIEDPQAIAARMKEQISALLSGGDLLRASAGAAKAFSRQAQANQLAEILTRVSRHPSAT